MEQILGTVISHDTIILSALVAGIAIILLLLLITNFSNHEAVVLSEYGRSDEFEGTLRRILGEKGVRGGVARMAPAAAGIGAAEGGAMDEAVAAQLEAEILEKDQKIAELQKQITQGAGGSEGAAGESTGSGNDEELLERIRNLEGRLEEYEIIEDDIADLSKFKKENDELRAELASLKGEPPVEEPPEPVAPPEAPPEGPKAPRGEDLVAEFEKIVNQGDDEDLDGSEGTEREDDEAVSETLEEPTGLGDSRVVDDGLDAYGEVMEEKLKELNAEPDSKEEAEVLIADLKNLKMGSQDDKPTDSE